MHIAHGNNLPLHAGRAAVTAAVAAACDAGVRKLLVDFHDWSGYQPPSLALRIDSVFEWAEAAKRAPGFAMALVMPPEMIDPGKIGFVIVCWLGFNFDVFGSVDDARAWLEGEAVFPTPGAGAPA